MKSKGNSPKHVYPNRCVTILEFNSYLLSALPVQPKIHFCRYREGEFHSIFFPQGRTFLLPSSFKNYSSYFTQVNSYKKQT